MVTQKQAKRKRDIKTKLMAAICMLLVSSIMMVSTTYAWFTLSTAPEVTGINTAVGANGNLEMALIPEEGFIDTTLVDYGITSNIGDSELGIRDRNTTWGNLVDLSEGTIYGLNQITLNPSKLNLTETEKIAVDGSMLLTPVYGADGRLAAALGANVSASTYGKNDDGSAAQGFPSNSLAGVRALGTASGMTDRQLDYRNYKGSAADKMDLARTKAGNSLNTNGAALTNIIVTHATNAEATFGTAEVNSLKAIVTDLVGENGILGTIEAAYTDYLVAWAASSAINTTDEVYTAVKDAATNGAAPGTIITAIEEQLGQLSLSTPEVLTTIQGDLQKLAATKQAATEAMTLLNNLTDATGITWEQIKKPMDELVDADAMTVNGMTYAQISADKQAFIDKVMADNMKVTATMATGGGVYADVADHCGNYFASITLNVNYSGMQLNGMQARMETASTVNPSYLSAVGTKVTDIGPMTGAGGQTMPLTDMYGYIIDLGFRTNATGSNLLLQTAAADRIYSDNTDTAADTWGGGSTMTFESTTIDFSLEQLQNLMGCIRVVFFDPADGTILGTAKLDMKGEVTPIEAVGGNKVTAGLHLYEEVAASTTYTAVDEEVFNAVKGGTNAEIKELYTMTPGAEGAADTYTKADLSNATWAADTYYKAETTDATTKWLKDNDAVITALTQNEAKAVSVMVYLDGEKLTNRDVAATANTSMTGTMNLQFASSANLVPMQYADLQGQGGASENEVAVTKTADHVDGADKATKGTAYTFTVKEGYKLDSISVGSNMLVAGTDYTVSGNTYSINADKVTGTIVIATSAGTSDGT